MNLKRKRCLVVLMLLIVGAGCAIVLTADSPQRDTGRLRSIIAVELPVGSHCVDVEKWLVAHNLEPKSRADAEGRVDAIWGSIYKEYTFYWNGEISVWFRFNRQCRLTEYGVDWAAYAP